MDDFHGWISWMTLLDVMSLSQLKKYMLLRAYVHLYILKCATLNFPSEFVVGWNLDLDHDQDMTWTWTWSLTIFIFLVARCTDMKKERKRNLIPAKVGINSIFLVGGASILYFVLIGLQVHLNNHIMVWFLRIPPLIQIQTPPQIKNRSLWESKTLHRA